MEKSKIKVIGIGDNVVDNYQNQRIRYPGGNALNFSVYAAMLGFTSAYLGVFGNDTAADHIKKTLMAKGIDISRCKNADGPNGEAVLRIEDGERIFMSSNQGGVGKDVPMEFIFNDLDYLKSFQIVHTGAYSYMDKYLRRLRQLEAIISYDFSDGFKEASALLLCPYIDVAFFSCSTLSKNDTMGLLKKATAQGCKLAMATRGANEAILYNGTTWHRKSPKKIAPIDTLGAGDAFITAFLVSYFQEKEKHMEKALEHAVSFAAEICSVSGAFGHGLPY